MADPAQAQQTKGICVTSEYGPSQSGWVCWPGRLQWGLVVGGELHLGFILWPQKPHSMKMPKFASWVPFAFNSMVLASPYLHTQISLSPPGSLIPKASC